MAQLFAIAILGIGCFALLGFVLILVFRIIALWVLIILSPLAFFLWALPAKQAQKGFDEWRAEFTKQVVIGPVMAFFIYLIILFFIANARTVTENSVTNVYGIQQRSSTSTRPAAGIISEPKNMLGFIVGVALMFVAMEVASKIGARGVSQAKGISNRAARFAGRATRKVARFADDAAYATGSFLRSVGSLKPGQQFLKVWQRSVNK